MRSVGRKGHSEISKERKSYSEAGKEVGNVIRVQQGERVLCEVGRERCNLRVGREDKDVIDGQCVECIMGGWQGKDHHQSLSGNGIFRG